jgi:hypothetical protein
LFFVFLFAGWSCQLPFQKRCLTGWGQQNTVSDFVLWLDGAANNRFRNGFWLGGAADNRSRNGFWLDGRIQKQFQKRLLVGVCSQPPFQKRFFAGGVQPNTVSDMGGQPNTVSEMVFGWRGIQQSFQDFCCWRGQPNTVSEMVLGRRG